MKEFNIEEYNEIFKDIIIDDELMQIIIECTENFSPLQIKDMYDKTLQYLKKCEEKQITINKNVKHICVNKVIEDLFQWQEITRKIMRDSLKNM